MIFSRKMISPKDDRKGQEFISPRTDLAATISLEKIKTSEDILLKMI